MASSLGESLLKREGFLFNFESFRIKSEIIVKYCFLSYVKYFAIGILVLMFHNLKAQASKEFGQDSKHSVHAEIGGRTLIWGSLNYEYALSKQFSLGGGFGVLSVLRGDITRNNGTAETGKYLDLATTQMIYGNYFIGESKNKLLLTAGLTNYLRRCTRIN